MGLLMTIGSLQDYQTSTTDQKLQFLKQKVEASLQQNKKFEESLIKEKSFIAAEAKATTCIALMTFILKPEALIPKNQLSDLRESLQYKNYDQHIDYFSRLIALNIYIIDCLNDPLCLASLKAKKIVGNTISDTTTKEFINNMSILLGDVLVFNTFDRPSVYLGPTLISIGALSGTGTIAFLALGVLTLASIMALSTAIFAPAIIAGILITIVAASLYGYHKGKLDYYQRSLDQSFEPIGSKLSFWKPNEASPIVGYEVSMLIDAVKKSEQLSAFDFTKDKKSDEPAGSNKNNNADESLNAWVGPSVLKPS